MSENEKKQLTLRELSEKIAQYLKEHPEHIDAPVYLEGCDCYGEAIGISECGEGDVLLKRNP